MNSADEIVTFRRQDMNSADEIVTFRRQEKKKKKKKF